jgi:hypothetical protein
MKKPPEGGLSISWWRGVEAAKVKNVFLYSILQKQYKNCWVAPIGV